MEVTGVEAPVTPGESLMRIIEKGPRLKDYAISDYHSHSVPGPMRMIRRGDWKLCWYIGSRPSLFNLRDDPNENHDLAGTGPTAQMVIDDLMALLKRGFDESKALELFQYAPNSSWLQLHRPTRTPNQRLAGDGTYEDVEDFYPPDTDWTAITKFRIDSGTTGTGHD
jgi:arylsulfatase A-like enzyme